MTRHDVTQPARGMPAPDRPSPKNGLPWPTEAMPQQGPALEWIEAPSTRRARGVRLALIDESIRRCRRWAEDRQTTGASRLFSPPEFARCD
jgi:hypothetical protein